MSPLLGGGGGCHMKRKTQVLLVSVFLVMALVATSEWLAQRSAVETEVAWSPLYERRVSDALVPMTSQIVYAGLQSAAAPCPTAANCNETWDCTATRDCQPTADCEDTFDCEPTSADTCRGTWTCEGWPTCAGASTCNEPDCTPSTLDSGICEGPTVDGPTCVGPRTCDVVICDWPTYDGRTCTRPTCDGPTCAGDTCDGPTCFLTQCDALDYGDAPEIPGTVLQYATRRESDGARHVIDGIFYLGGRLDAEPDGQPTELAVGDDEKVYSSEDDEDGIWFPTTFNAGRPAVVVASASKAGKLFAWMDYDMSGTWREKGDAVFPDGAPLAPGYNWVVVAVPDSATTAGFTFARFRFVESGILSPIGEAQNGEVEDYRVPLCATLRAWVMTDEVLCAPGDPLEISFYVNETSQVTLVRHRSDGTADVLWASTVEVGRHHYPDVGGVLTAALPEGTSTVEMIVTSLQSGNTVWLTTPYQVSR